MRVPECNQKVTGGGYKSVDGSEAINRWQSTVKPKPAQKHW